MFNDGQERDGVAAAGPQTDEGRAESSDDGERRTSGQIHDKHHRRGTSRARIERGTPDDAGQTELSTRPTATSDASGGIAIETTSGGRGGGGGVTARIA
ncbi:unnamed protein product [Dicrocoelium dendriticum]|nr:unnamed protein product [Dicrocoelium dendriticum]